MYFFRRCSDLILMILAIPTFAFANQIEQLKSLVSEQRMEQAYELAHSMRDEFSGNADFDFIYGSLARKLGHPEVAIFALERVIMENPKDAVAIYERGLALLDIHDVLGASVAFESVLSLNASEDLKSNAKSLWETTQAHLNSQKKRYDFWLRANTDIGFNSNVNSGAPGLDFILQGPEVKDGYVNIGVSTLYKRYFSKQDSVFISIASGNRKHFRSSFWDYNTLTARGGLEFRFQNIQLRLPGEFELVLIDYSFARLRPSLGFDASLLWNSSTVTTLSMRAATKKYVDSPDDHFTLPMTLQHDSLSLVDGLDLSCALSYAPGFSYANTPGPRVHSEVSLIGSLNYEFAQSHVFVPSLQINYFHYPVNLTSIQTRDDIALVGQVAYEWNLNSHWKLRPMFQYVYNYSTQAGQGYMRYEAQLGLRYEL